LTSFGVSDAFPSESTTVNANKAARSHQFKYQGHVRAHDR
jgi:hypothetical protein